MMAPQPGPKPLAADRLITSATCPAAEMRWTTSVDVYCVRADGIEGANSGQYTIDTMMSL